MTTQDDYTDALAAEQAWNEVYLRLMDEWTSGVAASAAALVPMAANTIWGGSSPTLPKSASGSLIGRVVLDSEDPELADFYVAPAHVEDSTVLVVSWVAPVAGLFYEGRDWDPERVPDPQSAPDPQTLSARRTFAKRGDRIDCFTDDIEPGTDRRSVFRRDAEPPSIPPPPAAPPVAPSQPGGGGPPGPPYPPAALGSPPSDDPDPRNEPDATKVEGESSGQTEDPERAMRSSAGLQRADRLVMDALDRPRDTRLHSILSTLQPDQHRHVTWPSTEHLAVQGHPGTGKTIEATHRAAFLTHADNSDRLQKVALVGPTDEWTSHVYGVLGETGAEGVDVISIETLIRELAGGSTQPLHRENEREFQTDWTIGRVVEKAVAELADPLSRMANPQKKIQLVTKRLVEACAMGAPLTSELTRECREWLRAARSYDHARNDASYLLFLASIGMAISPGPSKALYEHLIVDEVQDLRSAEWRILDTLLRPGGRWSLFGDMNQRRADVTWDSWASLLSHLDIGPLDGSTPEPKVLGTGYRSNDAILRYAGWLLPRHQREYSTLRPGSEEAVRVRRVGPTQLLVKAQEEAEQLTDEFRAGLVAVIAWNQEEVDRIRRSFEENGWRRIPGTGNTRMLALRETPERGEEPTYTRRLIAIRPVQARGLEFDGVVVVEPANFQQNLGRHGSLYTSLTRANKKLVVVHSRALPTELRRRTRKNPTSR